MKILDISGYVPKQEVYNDYFANTLETDDKWIRSRTGIIKRHIAQAGEDSSHLGYEAAKQILERHPDITIDLIICATTTAANTFPATATKIQNMLGISDIPSFDLQAVCSGFLYGLEVANSMSGKYQNILLICSEVMSCLLDWNDRSTCVLFGDGAGAVLLTDSEPESKSKLVDISINSDGSYYDMLYTSGGVSSNKTVGSIKMNGRLIFRNAIEKMTSSIDAICKKNNISIDEIDYFVPHQANIRIINAIANNLNFNKEKIITTVDRHANTSAASIPLALSSISNNIDRGQLILMSAFGAGCTWGSALIKW